MDTNWDCIVVGGGAAGLSAGLVLGRARQRTLVVDAGEQSNLPAHGIGGLLGFDGRPPSELYAAGREEIARYPSVQLRDGEVVAGARTGDGFELTLADGRRERTRRVLLATGMRYEPPPLDGVEELWGGTVFHCPFCHGWEVRDRPLVVYGEGEVAARQAALLAGWTDDVTVVAPDELAGLRVEDGALRAVVRRDGSEVPCDGILVHAPLRRRGRLAEQLGLELEDSGLVAVDAMARTSVPGVYAAGDLAVAPQQVAIALGSGHRAGVVATGELLLGHGAMAAPPSVAR
jgi:thioredoxin reductase